MLEVHSLVKGLLGAITVFFRVLSKAPFVELDVDTKVGNDFLVPGLIRLNEIPVKLWRNIALLGHMEIFANKGDVHEVF